MYDPQSDHARTTLRVLFVGGLALFSFWILRPFIPAFIWAVMVVVATWPLLRILETAFGHRRSPAVALMTLMLLLIFVVPVTLVIESIADRADDIATWVKGMEGRELPPPPDWVAELPLVGARVAAGWENFAASDFPQVAARLRPYLSDVARWLVTQVGSIGSLLIQCFLFIILSAVLFGSGEVWVKWLRTFGRRLADDQGEGAVVLAGQAIRGVALGVVVTAFVQASLGGVGLAIAGVPYAAFLTAIMFVLCTAQAGPMLILLPGTAWLFFNDQTGWGTFMLVWSVLVGFLDNFLRPILIKRSADLPLLLVFAGVIGGLLSFGLVGIFVGPVVLAVTYTLIDAWVSHRPDSAS